MSACNMLISNLYTIPACRFKRNAIETCAALTRLGSKLLLLFEIFVVMQEWINGMIKNCPEGHIWISWRKHCRWPSLQYAGANLILCGRPVNGWHVRC